MWEKTKLFSVCDCSKFVGDRFLEPLRKLNYCDDTDVQLFFSSLRPKLAKTSYGQTPVSSRSRDKMSPQCQPAPKHNTRFFHCNKRGTLIDWNN